LVELQVSIEEAPLSSDAGAAVSVTVGAGSTGGVSAGAEPPPPQALVSTAQVRSGIVRRIRVLESADASLPWRSTHPLAEGKSIQIRRPTAPADCRPG
jgi:hypothetical protein